jgi:hypothetical protein
MLERFNELVPDARDQLDVARLIRLRDALAHGRISTPERDAPMSLVKFGRDPDSRGQIHVETVLRMTDAWFTEQRDLTYDAVMRVQKYCQPPQGRRGCCSR